MLEALSVLVDILGTILVALPPHIGKCIIDKQEWEARQERKTKHEQDGGPINNNFMDGTRVKEEDKAYFEEAIEYYSKSIDESPTAAAYSNRATAYFKLNNFIEVEKDCTEALRIDDRFFEAYACRAMARTKLVRNLKGALTDAEVALELDPNSQEMKDLRSELNLMLGQ